MRRIFAIILTIAAAGLIAFCSGCGNNPAGPDTSDTYTLHITVYDENNEPLRGVEIITSPATVRHITGQNGVTDLENIPKGNYQIIVIHRDIPLFYQNITLDRDHYIELTFVVASRVDMNVYLLNSNSVPLPGVQISTDPPTVVLTTDQNGHVLFESIPLQEYTFYVSRASHNITYFVRKPTPLEGGGVADIMLTVPPQPPIVDIIFPRGNYTQSVFNMTFSGDGFDFEDGPIPEEHINWYSDIDGWLGYGRHLTLDRMSVGQHAIFLRVEDSDGNMIERTTGIKLYYYDVNSFFPIPKDAFWDYRFEVPEFTLFDTDGQEEQWKLTSILVAMQDVSSRSSTMQYTIYKNNRYTTAIYTVTDHLTSKDDSLYVNMTEEFLLYYDGLTQLSNPTREMDIETTYDNLAGPLDGGNYGYPLLKNHFDPASIPSFESTVLATSKWFYRDQVFGSQVYTEYLTVHTSINILGSETVITDSGTYPNAAVIRVRQGSSERTWWIAKSVGMVKMEFNTFGFPQTAVLQDTNILTFIDEANPAKRPAGTTRLLPPESGAASRVRGMLSTPDGTPERLREIRDILRGFIPG